VLAGDALSVEGIGGRLPIGRAGQDCDDDREEEVVTHDTDSLQLEAHRTSRKLTEARRVP
jgi:hypothetical protein